MGSVGIIYGSASNILRRVIAPDDPATLTNGTHFVSSQETMLIVESSTYNTATDLPTLFNQLTGLTAQDPRCAVISSSGAVLGSICADPAIDVMPGFTLALSSVADVGWTWTQVGGFVAPVIPVSTGIAKGSSTVVSTAVVSP